MGQYGTTICFSTKSAVSGRVIGEAIIQLAYGKLEDGQGRDYIQIATRLLEIMVFSLQGYAVDIFPVLQYLPAWLPGMKFKRDAAQWRKEICDLEETVFELVKRNMLSDDPEVQSSFICRRMQDLRSKRGDRQDVQERQDEEALLSFSGLQIFLGKSTILFCRNSVYDNRQLNENANIGALETTEATMQAFIRAMTLFPSVQKKAQAEIDRVIGSGRLPTFNDQPDLPYLRAVVLEMMRWNPALSINVPHASIKDDIYAGYFIPKGTGVIANAWGFSRNSNYYTNPSIFDPERFLKQPPELDPREFAFGYGRRTCPGKELGFQEVWILAASIFWAFDVVGLEDDPASLKDEDIFLFGMVK
ncbi:hypothetical protein FRC01_002766 [Tulasnella sp. 417]|nr:hypothetical protein FRC01_002766 [Tulasnella sp. 417]